MKKKIGELTLFDIQKICSNSRTCYRCPIGEFHICVECDQWVNPTISSELEEEVDIDE